MDNEISPLHQQLGLTFRWDKNKLWSIDLPIVQMPVKDFWWYLDYPFWSDEGGSKMVVTPMEVWQHPKEHEVQYRRVMTADLSYPVNAIYLNNKWLIMVGVHRLLKACVLGHKTILVKQAREKDITLLANHRF